MGECGVEGGRWECVHVGWQWIVWGGNEVSTGVWCEQDEKCVK